MASTTRRIKITHSASRVAPASPSEFPAAGDAEVVNSEAPSGSAPSDAEEANEETGTDVDGAESVSGSDQDAPVELIRGRGRPRGRPRGSRGGPGRPRGRGRGRGKGRGSVILRLPGFSGGDGDGEDSQGGELGDDGESE
jgi:chromatin structure-remodeling complex protein RSC7